MKLAISRKNAWERSPRAIKACLGGALRIIPPAYLLGKRFREALRFATSSQWWSAEQTLEYQLKQLRSICELAYKRTKYYRRSFDAIGFQPGDLNTLDDLRGLPLIDKETVRENLDEMNTVPLSSPGVDYVSTGGSSGRMLRFYIGAERSATEYAYLVSSWQRFGYRLGIPLAVIRGRIIPENQQGLRHEYDPLLRYHAYSNFHMTDGNMHAYLKHIATIGPCFFHAYPSAVDTLARFVRRSGAPVPENVKGIITESEIVLPDQRRYAEEVFKCRLSACYGHCEKLVLAAECEHSTDYHVWPTYGYCELLDEDGNAVTKIGKLGEIVGTGFINRVMPFIRYRTGDFAVYGGERCEECGRQQMLLTTIKGRWPQGCLIARDGSSISMTAINLHDDTLQDVVDYQFHQDTVGRAVLWIIPDHDLCDEERERILSRMSARLQRQVELTLEVRDKLDKTMRGKLKRVVQRIPGVTPA